MLSSTVRVSQGIVYQLRIPKPGTQTLFPQVCSERLNAFLCFWFENRLNDAKVMQPMPEKASEDKNKFSRNMAEKLTCPPMRTLNACKHKNKDKI